MRAVVRSSALLTQSISETPLGWVRTVKSPSPSRWPPLQPVEWAGRSSRLPSGDAPGRCEDDGFEGEHEPPGAQDIWEDLGGGGRGRHGVGRAVTVGDGDRDHEPPATVSWLTVLSSSVCWTTESAVGGP